MRYNAFFGELPINAFKPIGGKMTLHGGGNPISAVTDAVSDVVGGVVDKTMPIQISNVALVDANGKASRVGIKVEGGKKVRYLKTTGATLSA